MKLITFAIPSYNSEAYMRHCIDTILTGGEDVEIIIVNDGSKDNTGAIADEYAAKYPTICRAVHQENGGHGEGVNQGIRLGSGIYYKVVDSDDWVNEEALATILDTIKQHVAANDLPDLYISNFVYEHVADNTTYTRKYTKSLPIGRMFGWNEIKKMGYSESFLMHSLMYRMDKLRESGLELPKHTFYVDNIFAYNPLPFMSKIFYLDIDFYRYFIGRADQSINMENFSKRTEQQNRVMKIMIDAYDIRELKKQNKQLARYMLHNLCIMMTVTVAFTVAKFTKEKKQALRELWRYIKQRDRWLYYKLRYRSPAGFTTYVPGPLGRKIVIWGYKMYAKKIKLG